EALLLFGRVVLGVLGQVAVIARGGDVLDDLGAVHGFEPSQLFSEPRVAVRGHRDLLGHGRSLSHERRKRIQDEWRGTPRVRRHGYACRPMRADAYRESAPTRCSCGGTFAPTVFAPIGVSRCGGCRALFVPLDAMLRMLASPNLAQAVATWAATGPGEPPSTA